MEKAQIKHIKSEVRNVDEESRTITFIASTSTKDRHRSVVNQDNWQLERFNSNPVIGYQHNLYFSDNPDDIIGSGRAYVSEGRLMVDVTFEDANLNEKADKIYRKVKAGTINAVSVGFLPVGKGSYGTKEEARGAENETYYFEGQELLEVSVVNIPSNPDALAKGYTEEEVMELRSIITDYDNEIKDNDVQSSK